MTILNRQNDGLYSILLTLTRTVVLNPNISRDKLIDLCLPHNKDNDSRGRARGTLNRWIDLGLFSESGKDKQIQLNQAHIQGQSVEQFMERLPDIGRTLALARGEPLWPDGDKNTEEGTGLTADLCRGLAWCLAQDIYTLPSTWTEINNMVGQQIQPDYFIFMNDTRWAGLRSWARFLDFATGDGDRSFFLDPTVAVRSGLQQVITGNEPLLGQDCISGLAQYLPVLDGGSYRQQVEQIMRPEQRNRLDPGHLSTALSFALRRLQKQGIIELITMADAGTRLTLIGEGQREWHTFTHIRLVGEIA